MKIAHLTNRQIIKLSGKDAAQLLQGIITQDVSLLDSTPLLFSSLLSPQGKFLFDFFLMKDGDAILIDIDASYFDAFKTTLKRYKLRSDVTIEESDHSVYALWENDHSDIGCVDPRLAALGWRHLSSEPLETNASAEDYNHHRLTLSVPDGVMDSTERSFVMELGYDQLNAISFTKGCYVGQEVTARMHYRKSLKKCLFNVTAESGQNLPEFGTTITQDGVELGEMRSSDKNIGLALIKWADYAENSTILAGDIPIQLSAPTYMQSKLIDIRENALNQA
ncbi:MAG: hypothetical protein MRY32_08010 [Rickettsiales bacterium]|nr:hypothetical protein [Rickettsiales bacterium]